MNIQSIVFTGGGSAGHVVPNIALIEDLKNLDVKIAYIGSEEGIEKKLIKPLNISYYAITTGKLRRYFSVKNFLDPFKIIWGVIQAWWCLGKIKPQVVFSKGGFVAFPVVFAAWMHRIPVVAHESDLTPGLANRLSFPFVKKIALTFSQTKMTKEEKNSEKCVITGTPLRKKLFEGSPEKGQELCGFQHRKDLPCILVIGGGSGAAVINAAIRQALSVLVHASNVIHCCGQGKIEPSLNALPGYKQFEYVTDELAHLYSCADVVISRAGANTVYEILALKKPAIFIPLSLKASRGDQIANANFLESQGLCCVIDESHLTADLLIERIQEILEQHSMIEQKITNYGVKSGTDAVINLINEVSRG